MWASLYSHVYSRPKIKFLDAIKLTLVETPSLRWSTYTSKLTVLRILARFSMGNIKSYCDQVWQLYRSHANSAALRENTWKTINTVTILKAHSWVTASLRACLHGGGVTRVGEVKIACEQAHLVRYSREYLGGAAICESASEASRREEWGRIPPPRYLGE